MHRGRREYIFADEIYMCKLSTTCLVSTTHTSWILRSTVNPSSSAGFALIRQIGQLRMCAFMNDCMLYVSLFVYRELFKGLQPLGNMVLHDAASLLQRKHLAHSGPKWAQQTSELTLCYVCVQQWSDSGSVNNMGWPNHSAETDVTAVDTIHLANRLNKERSVSLLSCRRRFWFEKTRVGLTQLRCSPGFPLGNNPISLYLLPCGHPARLPL